jgi:hypothetical protein
MRLAPRRGAWPSASAASAPAWPARGAAAPVSGVIARADLVVGQVVEPRDLLFEVVDPARMLVEATTADAGLATRLAAASLQGVPDVTLRLLGASRSMRDGVLPIIFAVSASAPGTGAAAGDRPAGHGDGAV